MSEQKIELRPAVQWFAEQMEAALRRNDRKKGWTGAKGLLGRLFDEAEELKAAHGPDNIIRECADVANFAMMIADNEGPNIGAAGAPTSTVDPRKGDRVATDQENLGVRLEAMYRELQRHQGRIMGFDTNLFFEAIAALKAAATHPSPVPVQLGAIMEAVAEGMNCAEDAGENPLSWIQSCVQRIRGISAMTDAERLPTVRLKPLPLGLSRDYNALYEHINEGGEALGLKDGPGKRHLVILSLGACGIPKDYGRSAFVKTCEQCNLEWVAPQRALTDEEIKQLIRDYLKWIEYWTGAPKLTEEVKNEKLGNLLRHYRDHMTSKGS